MSKLTLNRETLRVLDAPDVQGGVLVTSGVIVVTKFATCICPVILTHACLPTNTFKPQPDPWKPIGH